jgi:hypothetical protein
MHEDERRSNISCHLSFLANQQNLANCNYVSTTRGGEEISECKDSTEKNDLPHSYPHSPLSLDAKCLVTNKLTNKTVCKE